jgi:hypothetical protein
MSPRPFAVGRRRIGTGEPVFVIAETSRAA